MHSSASNSPKSAAHTPLSISISSRKNNVRSKVMQSLSSRQNPSKSLSKTLKKSSLVKIKKPTSNKKQPEEVVPKHIEVINQAKERMQDDH
jgi:hypothetical protein